jgi:hypothetical protein
MKESTTKKSGRRTEKRERKDIERLEECVSNVNVLRCIQIYYQLVSFTSFTLKHNTQ